MSRQSLTRTIANITRDQDLQRRLKSMGLTAVNVTWEDTGRSKDSSVGPNISDMTLQVDDERMPVIRAPNFSDKTVDVSIDKFNVTVGNENGSGLKRIPLKEYLENIGKYTSSNVPNMYRPRDASVLVSGQACILPLSDGKVSFNVALYNYQSEREDPAVLTIMATEQGTSAQVLDNETTGLYFNDNGKAVDMVAKRLADDRAARGVTAQGPMSAEEQAKNVVYVFQVPLKTKPRAPRAYASLCSYGGNLECCAMSFDRGVALGAPRGMDDAILEKGTDVKGPFEGTRGLALERDDRFPIRATIQFYRVTDSTFIPNEPLEQFQKQLECVYSKGANEGSLVTEPNKGRPTEHNVPISAQPPHMPVPCPEPAPFVFF